MARLKIKVVPGAASSEVVGWLGDSLKLRVAAPPEKGRANRAVIELLAAALGVPASAVTIVGGHGSPSKILEIDNIDASALEDALAGYR